MWIRRLVLAAFFGGFPALAQAGARRFRVLEWVGPVVLCYFAGIVLAYTLSPYLA